MSQEAIENALTDYFMRSSLYLHKERRLWNTEAKYILNLLEGAGYRKQPALLTDEEILDALNKFYGFQGGKLKLSLNAVMPSDKAVAQAQLDKAQ